MCPAAAQRPRTRRGENTAADSKLMEDLKQSIVHTQPDRAAQLARRALDRGCAPADIIDRGLGAGMKQIGDDFNAGKVYLPQILAASKTMDAALEVLIPVMAHGRGAYRGTVVMGSVQGDIHEIGKNVCVAMLRGAGYRVVDLGADVSPQTFIETTVREHADVIAASALMTTTLFAQQDLVRWLAEDGSKVPAIIGGAPCSQAWCDEIGAAGYSASAGEIVPLVDRLLEQAREHGA